MDVNERVLTRGAWRRGATRPVSMPPRMPRHSRASGNLLGASVRAKRGPTGGVRPRKREPTPRRAGGHEIPAYAGMTGRNAPPSAAPPRAPGPPRQRYH